MEAHNNIIYWIRMSMSYAMMMMMTTVMSMYLLFHFSWSKFIHLTWMETIQSVLYMYIANVCVVSDRRMICWAAVFWLFWYLLSQIIDPIWLMLFSLPMGQMLHFIIANIQFQLAVKYNLSCFHFPFYQFTTFEPKIYTHTHFMATKCINMYGMECRWNWNQLWEIKFKITF